MERINIEISKKFIDIKSQGKIFPRDDLKKINKHVSKTIGPETANILVKFLQVWNEEKELSSVLPRGNDVPKRPPNTVVDPVERPNLVRRKRRGRRRKAD